MMKKVAIVVIFLCTLLAVVSGSAEEGFCWSYGGRVFVDMNGDGIATNDEGVENVGVIVWERLSDGTWIDALSNGGEIWNANGSAGSGLTNSDGKWGFSTLSSSKTYKLQLDLTGLSGYAFDLSQTTITGLVYDGGYTGGTIEITFDPTTGFSGTFSPGSNAYGFNVKLVTPIPSAAILFGSGLIGLVGIRRKFKKA